MEGRPPRLQHLPSIATYTDSEDAQMARKTGADAFFIKPVERDHLRDIVSQTLAQSSTGTQSLSPAPALLPEQGLSKDNAYLVRKLEKRSQDMETLAAERQEAIEALVASEAQFLALADHSLDMILQTKPNHMLQWADRAACEGF